VRRKMRKTRGGLCRTRKLEDRQKVSALCILSYVSRLGLRIAPKYCAGTLEQSIGVWNRLGIGLSYRPARAGIFKESMGARNRGGRGLSYRPARLHRLAEFIPWNQYRGPIHV
jgi:hypothetical protein